MSVSRDIIIRIASNFLTFADLFEAILDEEMKAVYSTVKVNDTDNFDYIIFENYESVRKIFIERERKGLRNYASACLLDFETLHIVSETLEDKYEGYSSHHVLSISPGVGKRIQGAEISTDFGFYLKIFLPKLTQLGCYVCEVNCHDFDC